MQNSLSRFLLLTDDIERQGLAGQWLWLSVMSLLGAGVFSVLLVLSRTPLIGEIFPYKDFFHTALVIHVDLSVLVWSLSFAGVLWSIAAVRRYRRIGKVIWVILVIATLMMMTAAFLPAANPTMSNYIPILDTPLFLTGLVAFGAGIGLLVISAVTLLPPIGRGISKEGVIIFGLDCAAISVLVALACFCWAWYTLPNGLSREFHYELLFWGGGHVLQYTYTLLMMVSWLWLSSLARIELIMSERVLLVIFLVGLLSVFVAPVIYAFYEVTSPEHRAMFTWLMSFGGSLATFPLGLAIYLGLVQRKADDAEERLAHSALMASLLMFGCGGIIGFMIDGSNVTIPAHYHGCIVGVTLALMGVAYNVIPGLGYQQVNLKWANVQIWLYASGQFLHIAGLVWSGGYGVQRKVAGAEQALDSIERVAGMGLMGFGGLLSAIGGLLFVIIAVRAMAAGREGLAVGSS